MKIRNVSTFGDVELHGRVIPAGDVFDVSDDLGALLLEQPANFVAVKAREAKEATK